jgi:hypothetical protein
VSRLSLGAAASILALAGASPSVLAQDLSPRAYLITPLRANAITVANIFNDGELLIEGAVPVTGATGRLNMPNLTITHSLSFFGRSANVAAALAYGVGHFKGTVVGAEIDAYRSGLFDSIFRFSVNLKGAPAMAAPEFVKWRQKLLIGASLKVAAPTGQYDPTKLINLGANRWAFKPEVGVSRRWGSWILDAYAGMWFFTENPEFFSRNQYFPGTQSQTQEPIAAFETHLSYDFRPRLWVSFDANFWRGGRTSLNGVQNPATLQQSSRVGVTASFPVTRRQSIKVGYADGAYVRFGGNYKIASFAWQYAWVSKPK